MVQFKALNQINMTAGIATVSNMFGKTTFEVYFKSTTARGIRKVTAV